MSQLKTPAIAEMFVAAHNAAQYAGSFSDAFAGGELSKDKATRGGPLCEFPDHPRLKGRARKADTRRPGREQEGLCQDVSVLLRSDGCPKVSRIAKHANNARNSASGKADGRETVNINPI